MKFLLAALFVSIDLAMPRHMASQEPVGTPVHAEMLSLVAGRGAIVRLPQLEPGRMYNVRVVLSNQSAPASESWVDVELWNGDQEVGADRIDPGAAVIKAAVQPRSPDAVSARIRAGGEIGAVYRVRVEWQAVPVAWMPEVNWISSPNQGVRPPGANVNAVVVHATVIPTLEKTLYHFLNRGSQVSAHYVVGKDGTIVQMVDDTARAWHAGVSELAGVQNVNDFSVGIEIVNLNDGRDRFTEPQYKSVAAIIHHLRQQYPIPDSRIVSHEQVARPPGRKNDPRGFSFPHVLGMLHAQ